MTARVDALFRSHPQQEVTEPAVEASPVGRYEGRKLVRPGREDELSRKELSDLKKMKETYPLELRTDGSFVWKKAFEGHFRQSGNVLTFQPARFSGQTLTEMRRKAEDLGRVFTLAFIFEPFRLRLEGDTLVSLDDTAPWYLEYRKL